MDSIENIEVIEEFHNIYTEKVHGIYKLKFKGESLIFVRSEYDVYALSHTSEAPRLDIVRMDVKKQFLKSLENIKSQK